MDLSRPFLIGVIHLPPLPGSPGWRGDAGAIAASAVEDARSYLSGGFDAVIIENFGDMPFFKDSVPPETVAGIARAAAAVRETVGDAFPIGFNVLRNDAAAALALSAAFCGEFIRVNVHCGAMVTDQGLIEGQAAATLRKRALLCPGVRIFADVMVKHASPLCAADSLVQAARDTWQRGRADALIVSGAGTGWKTEIADLRTVRESVPEAPLLVGSGATAGAVAELLEFADGVIVGSSLKRGGVLHAPVDPAAVAKFAAAARG